MERGACFFYSNMRNLIAFASEYTYNNRRNGIFDRIIVWFQYTCLRKIVYVKIQNVSIESEDVL